MDKLFVIRFRELSDTRIFSAEFFEIFSLLKMIDLLEGKDIPFQVLYRGKVSVPMQLGIDVPYNNWVTSKHPLYATKHFSND